jgi:ribosomal protein L2
MSAKVAFLQRPVQAGEQIPRLAVNRTSVVTRSRRQVVLRIQGNRAAEVPVKTGGQFGEMIEVFEGLRAGDRIIARPTAAIKDGGRIKIAEP